MVNVSEKEQKVCYLVALWTFNNQKRKHVTKSDWIVLFIHIKKQYMQYMLVSYNWQMSDRGIHLINFKKATVIIDGRHKEKFIKCMWFNKQSLLCDVLEGVVLGVVVKEEIF